MAETYETPHFNSKNSGLHSSQKHRRLGRKNLSAPANSKNESNRLNAVFLWLKLTKRLISIRRTAVSTLHKSIDGWSSNLWAPAYYSKESVFSYGLLSQLGAVLHKTLC